MTVSSRFPTERKTDMISFQVYVPAYAGAYVEGTCLSTDTLPIVGFVTGSKMKILDAEAGTITEAMYDTESMSWIDLVTEEAAPEDADAEDDT